MRRRSERAGPVACVATHAVVVRCRLAGRASAAAARRAHDPRHRRRRRCGRVPTPSSTRFSSWTSASAAARGSVCRGASTSSQLRTTALLEAARSLRSTEATSSRCRPPSSPYAEYRRAGRRALGRVWATTASSTELRRYGRFGSCHVLPCDNAQQHVQLVQPGPALTAPAQLDGARGGDARQRRDRRRPLEEDGRRRADPVGARRHARAGRSRAAERHIMSGTQRSSVWRPTRALRGGRDERRRSPRAPGSHDASRGPPSGASGRAARARF